MRALRFTACLSAALLLAIAAGAAPDSLPTSPGLQPQVDFWVRVYTEVGTDGGFVHDSRRMHVYETLHFGEGLSRRDRDRRREAAKKRYVSALKSLATGKRSGLSSTEKQVLALWGADTSSKTFGAAAKRVRFQLGQANKTKAGLIRAGAWKEYVEQTMASEGVPIELAALPLVESSYNPEAYSHAGAAGMWQFMRSTGKIFMRVDHVVDERMDTFAATRAAAQLLRSNYERLSEWPLAITAYNHGAGGMERAARQLGTTDMATIVERYQSRSFGFASRNFYTSLLAAVQVMQNAETYFGPMVYDAPVDYEVVVLDHYYPASALVRGFGVDHDTLRTHNLSLRPAVWGGKKRVPRGFVLRIPRSASTPPAHVALAGIAASEKHSDQIRDRFHKVRRGESLGRIASRYGVRQSELASLNGLRNRNRIRVGQVLRLPAARGGSSRVRSLAPKPSEPTQVAKTSTYVVRRGDTLSSIGRKFGVSSSKLQALNGLRSRNKIFVGQRLKVTGVAAKSVTYRVRRGDTLSSIARRFGVSVQQIITANRIPNRNRLRVGQRLRIPRA